MPRARNTDALEARIDDDILLTKGKMPLEIVVDTDDELRRGRAYLESESAKHITITTRSAQVDLWPAISAENPATSNATDQQSIDP